MSRQARLLHDLKTVEQVMPSVETALLQGDMNRENLKLCMYRFNKLPRLTQKTIFVGPRGGMYYVNSEGHKVYLNSRKRQRLMTGRLPRTQLSPQGRRVLERRGRRRRVCGRPR